MLDLRDDCEERTKLNLTGTIMEPDAETVQAFAHTTATAPIMLAAPLAGALALVALVVGILACLSRRSAKRLLSHRISYSHLNRCVMGVWNFTPSTDILQRGKREFQLSFNHVHISGRKREAPPYVPRVYDFSNLAQELTVCGWT